MKVLVRTISDEDIEELRSAFTIMDREHTGLITIEDLKSAMEKHGFNLAHEELNSRYQADIITKIGYDGAGVIGYTEFLVATLRSKRLIDEELLWDVFVDFDRDRDNVISCRDIKDALTQAGC